MANSFLSGLLGSAPMPAAGYNPYAPQKLTGQQFIGDALQAVAAAMTAQPTQRGMIFQNALQQAQERRKQQEIDQRSAYMDALRMQYAQQDQARADQKWQWEQQQHSEEQARKDKLRGYLEGAFKNSGAGAIASPNWTSPSSGYNPTIDAARPYYEAGMYPEAFSVLNPAGEEPYTLGENQVRYDKNNRPVAWGQPDQKSPTVQKFYDEAGQEYYAQWNAATGAWDKVGGAKPQGSGITYTDANGNTIQIGGGAKPLTESQAKDTSYAIRAEGSNPYIEQYGSALLDPVKGYGGELPGVGNYIKGAGDPNYQLAEQAGNDFLTALLRKESGATITPPEQALYGRTFLPQPGDRPEVIKQKAEARKRAIAGINAGLPPLAILEKEKALEKSAPAPSTTGKDDLVAPQPGTVEDGYQFNGGDPADPNNWIKVQ